MSERSEWRKAIEQRTYDAQTDKLTWGEGRSKSTLTKMLGMNSRSQNEEQGIGKNVTKVYFIIFIKCIFIVKIFIDRISIFSRVICVCCE